eukprot:gene646-800_t
MYQRIPPQQRKLNKLPLKDTLTINITDFSKTCKLLFDSLYAMSIGQQHQNIISSSPMHSPTLMQNVHNINNDQQQQQQQQQQQTINPLQFMNLLIEADKNLQKTLKQRTEIVKIQKEIEEKDQLISSLTYSLKDVESFLENEIQEIDDSNSTANNLGVQSKFTSILKKKKNASGMDDSASTSSFIDNATDEQIQKNKTIEISPEELISYAHKISGTTSAPFGYDPNVPLISLYKPPAPQEDLVRMSTLFNRLPPNILKVYGLAEKDLIASATVQQQKQQVSPTLDSKMDLDNQPTNKDQQFEQPTPTTTTNTATTNTAGNQPPLGLTSPPTSIQPPSKIKLDLDLNPDLDSDEESDEDDSNEDVDWDE